MAGGTEREILGEDEAVEKERNDPSSNSAGGPATAYSAVSVQKKRRRSEYLLLLLPLHLQLRCALPFLPLQNQAKGDWLSKLRRRALGVEEPRTEDPTKSRGETLRNCRNH